MEKTKKKDGNEKKRKKKVKRMEDGTIGENTKRARGKKE